MRCFSLFNSLSGNDGFSKMSDASGIHGLALSLKPDAVKVAVSDPHGACAPMVAPSSSICSAICLLDRVCGAFLQHGRGDVGKPG